MIGAEEQDLDTTVVRRGLFPLLAGQTPPFKEALDWLPFAYTADQTGDYMAPASTVLVQSTVVEWDALFPAYLQHLWKRYQGAYAPSTLDPGPEYLVAPTVLKPKRREPNHGEEGERVYVT